jgi:hypothetical protein
LDVALVADVADTRESTNGRVPLPGDADFLDFILAAHRAGHVTTAEALEREQAHKLIERPNEAAP